MSPLDAYRKRAGGSFEAGEADGLKWREDGQLEWEMDKVAVERGDKEHPIVKLLERGERQWQALVGREPQTLRSVQHCKVALSEQQEAQD